MNRPALLLLLSMVLAGCGGSVPHPRTPDASSLQPLLPPGCDPTRPAVVHHADGVLAATVHPSSAVPCLMRTGGSSGEPTLGVCPTTGTVFMGPFYGGGGSGAERGAVKSTDQGATWTKITPNLAGVGTYRAGLDPYFYLDPATCRIFVDDWVASCNTFDWSDDEGATWTNGISNCGQTDHQTIFSGPPVTSPTLGFPNIVYICAINLVIVAEGSFATTCQKSLNGGLSWLPTGAPPYVADPTQQGRYGINGVCDGASGHGKVGPTGIVYLPKGLCGVPMLAVSRDEGATWTRVSVSDLGMPVMTSPEGAFYEHEASVGVDTQGNLYYVWAANDRMVHLTVSKDQGATWTRALNISAPGLTEAALVQSIAGAPGHFAAVYMGSLNSPGHFPTRAACDPDPATCVNDAIHSEPQGPDPPGYGNTTWNAYIVVSDHALSDHPTFWTAPVNDPADPLVRGICGPIRCPGVGDFIDIRYGPDGTPWASLIDACNADCATGTSLRNSGTQGVVGRLYGGPSLLG